MNIEWKILMNNFKIPKIRFMNFNDKWDYKTLDEISKSIEYGLNASAKDFDGIHKYIRITDINDSSRLFLTDKLSSPDVDFTLEEYDSFKLQKNDLLFSRTGASVGKTYLYRDSDGEVYYAGFLIRARLGELSDGNFIFQQTLTDKYKRFIEITSQRSGQPGVNGKEYGDWALGMTSLPEQSAIGSLFRTFDDLLNSYKGNLVNYQSLKATMLSKMFPKAGQTVPEIRLDGFTGEWKFSSIGEQADITKLAGFEFTKHVVYSDEGEIPAIRGLNVKNQKINLSDVKYIDRSDFSKLNRSKLIENDLLFTYVGTVGEVARVPENVLWYLAPNVSRIRLNRTLDSRFVLYQMTSNRFKQKQIAPLIATSSQPALSMANIRKFIVSFTTLEEQQAIGSYFSSLDQLITSYQEKITQLETLKKKLLQDMFI